jgi:hypothetical protein
MVSDLAEHLQARAVRSRVSADALVSIRSFSTARSSCILLRCSWIRSLVSRVWTGRSELVTLLLRPVFLFAMKKAVSIVSNYAVRFNPAPHGKLRVWLSFQLFLNVVNVKLATGSANVQQLVVNLLCDWALFALRLYTFWFATKPGMDWSKMSWLLKLLTFDKAPPAFPEPLMYRPQQLRAHEFIVESMMMTTAYISSLVSYSVLSATGIEGGNPVFAFFFPFGAKSFHFMLVGFANDFVQDFMSHEIAEAGDRRHGRTCKFTRIDAGPMSSFSCCWQMLQLSLAVMGGACLFCIIAFALRLLDVL